jgi:hypothetical protein
VAIQTSAVGANGNRSGHRQEYDWEQVGMELGVG